jgi:hypothetical protein
MKYSVINTLASPPRVKGSYPFHWMAHMAAVAWEAAGCHGIEVAETTTDPQEVINICVQRDSVAAERQELAVALWGLVARDDTGVWTTVHNPDTAVDPSIGAILDRLTA